MGFFSSLFGGKKEEPKQVAPAPSTAPAQAPVATGVDPKVIAAIAAVTAMDDEMEIAAIAAAIIHAQGGCTHALRIKRSSTMWAAAGRQKIMDGRNFA